MIKILWHILPLLFVTSLAHASEDCEKALTKYSQTQSLPVDAIAMIKNHRGLQRLSNRFKTGQNLEFSSPYFTGPDDLIKTSGWFGEAIQTGFIREVLKVVFPKASFAKNYAPHTYRLRIPISVRDSSVSYDKPKSIDELRNTGHLEMCFLKSANPTKIGENLDSLRAILNVPATSTVVSIYVSERYLSNATPILPFLERLTKPVIIFLSVGGGVISKERMLTTFGANNPADTLGSLFENIHAFGRTISACDYFNLSELNRSHNFSHERPTVVLNDTFGKTPEVYQVSDLAVVIGPINFLEPLNYGVPTLFFSSRQFITNLSSFEHMANVAARTGGGYPVYGPEDFDSIATAALAARNKIIAPYLVRQIPFIGRTEFNDFLDYLYRYLLVEFAREKYFSMNP